MICEHEDKIFKAGEDEFQSLALDIFRFQVETNEVYSQFVAALKINHKEVTRIDQIPFLPVEFFKSKTIKSTTFIPEKIFESSGTTGSINSRHHVRKLELYRKSFIQTFEQYYGPVSEWCIIGLLPSYLERGSSSLVAMVDELIRRSGNRTFSGFYLYDFEGLATVLKSLEAKNQKTLVIGVTFALLDFAKQFPMKLSSTIIMETGGMKGRKREMPREEVHEILQTAFGLATIHAEYGMTELLSQAYSKGSGYFTTPPWMKILLRSEDDPLHIFQTQREENSSKTGLINVIDLANMYSCSFIATDDIGRLHPNNLFEVLGRRDNADIRGCSLMVASI